METATAVLISFSIGFALGIIFRCMNRKTEEKILSVLIREFPLHEMSYLKKVAEDISEELKNDIDY